MSLFKSKREKLENAEKKRIERLRRQLLKAAWLFD